MKIVFEIPKEFESHFEFDRFADSLARVASDIEALGFKMSGRYERETITMIRKAFENATPLPKGHGRLIDADNLIKELEEFRHIKNKWGRELFSDEHRIGIESCISKIDSIKPLIEAYKKVEE